MANSEPGRSTAPDKIACNERFVQPERGQQLILSQSGTLQPSPELLQHITKLYFDLYENQPLLPLTREDARENLPDQVIFGMVAVAARYSDHSYFQDEASSPQAFNKKARHFVFNALESCETGLATVQAICLITFADYLDGSVERANLTLGIGVRLAYSMRLLRSRTLEEMSEDEDIVRCCWSLFAMERLFALGSGVSMPLIDENDLPRYPISPDPPPHVTPFLATAGETPVDLGIMACCLQLTATWGKAIKYALRHKSHGNSQLPWTAESEYSQAMSHILQFEAVFPNHHRWQVTRFHQQGPADLKRFRAYWDPWMLMQFLYHSCLALVNHPVFFLGETPTAFSQLPPSFAQSVSSQAQMHSRWITYFASLLQERDFGVVDPFLAYGASVAATIHAFYAASQNQEASQRAKRDLSICIRLVRNITTALPSVQSLADKLEKLGQGSQLLDVSSSSHPDLSRGDYTDIVWGVLEYTKPSQLSTEFNRSDRIDAPVDASSARPLRPSRNTGPQEQSATDALVEYLGILPFFSCPDFTQSSLDEYSFGNL
ncbi:Transcription factor fungi [Macrophomina phaseolina MS6]|uniref:Transcription factor fungi n=1 Tax=Macrophomina phaseolina (strain MS6) TaxID=1126212 RepID=K2RTX4_MACPH|nr:Transcription factor fungi [Macrophomina phaseolina MS6]